MSKGGPTRELAHDFYGRIVKLEVQTNPKKAWGVGLGLLAFGAVCVFFGVKMESADGFIVMLCGAVLVPIALFIIYGGIRLTNTPTMHVKLGLKTLRYPRGTMLWRAHEEEVRLLEIPHVALVTQSGQMGVRFTHPDGSAQTIQQAWLPEGWSVCDLYILLQMRIRGARQQLDRAQQVAAEAQVFAPEDVLGVVVDTRGKRPEVLALVHDLDDYETLMAEDDFPHADHRLVVPADKVEAVQGAVKERILSALDVDLERPV